MSTKGFSNEVLDYGTKRCYESHPALKVGEYTIYGGACSHPIVTDADVYVALQSGGASGYASDPWEPTKVVEVTFFIPDMGVPKNVTRFKKMVTWICNQLQAGKKVHIGCIGGHGRTGTVLAAIAAELGEKDAIQYVRKNYCKKAVESNEQAKFLHQHYGVPEVEGYKDTKKYRSQFKSSDVITGGSKFGNALWDDFRMPKSPASYPKKVTTDPLQDAPACVGKGKTTRSLYPIPSSARNIWKARKNSLTN